jgi:alpha-methylacyl-CoA racemase
VSGPLTGLKVLEIAGIGPGPFCGMVLADLGADVVRIDRAERVTDRDPAGSRFDLLARGRRSIGVDLKHPEGVATVLDLVEHADVLIEGFRPGVAERLGIGPDACLARSPRLVYGRMTGWGQTGPYAHTAGHDINYIALSGALHPIGRRGEAPVPPVNFVGDFGGGGMLLALGVCAAVIEARISGIGQVVDAAMTDGSALLTTMFHGLAATGAWTTERGTNLLDTGSHMYDVFECADGEYISLGSLEPQFYAEMCLRLGIPIDEMPEYDRPRWPEFKERIKGVVREKTRDEWCALLEGTDVCFAPVLSLTEAPAHPHNRERETFVEVEGVMQPAPAPRFSRTPGAVRRPPSAAGQHTDEALGEWGFSADRIAALKESGAIA